MATNTTLHPKVSEFLAWYETEFGNTETWERLRSVLTGTDPLEESRRAQLMRARQQGYTHVVTFGSISDPEGQIGYFRSAPEAARGMLERRSEGPREILTIETAIKREQEGR